MNYWFKAQFRWASAFENMTDAELGRFTKALFQYATTGEKMVLEGKEGILFSVACKDLEVEKEYQIQLCEKRSRAGKKSAAARAAYAEASSNSTEPEHVVQCDEMDPTPVNKINKKNNTKTKIQDKRIRSDIVAGSDDGSQYAEGIALKTTEGLYYSPVVEDVLKWQTLYPAIDVMQELRGMMGWLDANPKNRKTASGVPRFINHWLEKAQNSARPENRSSDSKTVVDRYAKNPFEAFVAPEMNPGCVERKEGLK